MREDEITALAKGLVPFVHECVAEAIGRNMVPTVRECVTEIVNKNMIVPPEIASQIASAIRLLHESPALVERADPPVPESRIIRVERDEQGNFIPVYDEPQK